MPNYGGALRGAASGAGLGLGLTATGIGAPLGIPLTVLGAGAGLLSGLFSKSDEELRAERIKALRNIYAEKRRSRLSDISKETQGLQRNAAFRSARLARSQGRESDVQSNAIPAEANVLRAGEYAKRRANEFFDTQDLNLENDIAAEPLPTQPVDIMESLGSIGSSFYRAKSMLAPGETELAKREVEGAQASPSNLDNLSLGIAPNAVTVEPYQGPVYQPGEQPESRGTEIERQRLIQRLRRRGTRY
jgi:hypothetical protein